MAGVKMQDNRQRERTGTFQVAHLRVIGLSGDHQVTIRNLSEGGVMAAGNAPVMQGTPLMILINGIGWVEGAVAWTQDERFGISFARPIDPAAALDDKAQAHAALA